MASLIEDYALIGDCHTAALVGRDGSIDWLCFPRFDSGACFAALLGTEEHGRWLLSPANQIKNIQRRYREGSLVLETDYETGDGAVTLVDSMPPRSKEADLVRLIVGRRGKVRMRMQLIIRFDYGSIVPWVRAENNGIYAVGGPDILVLKTNIALQSEGATITAEFTVSEGERIPFVYVASIA
jgi:GH15 family glucan-1,4-alpha-glucosidase